MTFDNINATCPFNVHKPCVSSCMFVLESETMIVGCKLKPKDLTVMLDPEGALIHISETLDKLLDKL